MVATLFIAALWLGAGCVIAGILHELEAHYRPFRQAPERRMRGGSRRGDWA